MLSISDSIQHFQKCFTDYYRGARDLHKKCSMISGFAAQLRLLFQVENGLHGKNENIKYLWHYATVFHHFSPCVWKSIRLLKMTEDDLDVIDRGHSKGNVSQFYLYLSNTCTNFSQIWTKMVLVGNKSVSSSDLENVGQGHH